MIPVSLGFSLSIIVRFSDCRKQVSCYRKLCLKYSQHKNNPQKRPLTWAMQTSTHLTERGNTASLLIQRHFCGFSMPKSLATAYPCDSVICWSLSGMLAFCGKLSLTVLTQQLAVNQQVIFYLPRTGRIPHQYCTLLLNQQVYWWFYLWSHGSDFVRLS